MFFERKKICYILTIISFVLFVLVVDYCSKKDDIIKNPVSDVLKDECYFENIYLIGNVDSLQKIKLFKMEKNEYYAFVPSEMRTDVYIHFDMFEKILLDDNVYHNGDELTDIYKGEPYEIKAMDNQNNILEEATLKFIFTVDVPTVYIESFNGTVEKINNDKTLKEKAEIGVICSDGTKDIFAQCSLKARGNTAFTARQKSYSLNFESTQSILGSSACSEWALLANYGKSTQQLKNKIVLDLAKMLELPFTPETEFVNVYIDNQYNGLYLLSQKISADGGTVEFSNEKNGGGDRGKAFLLELDARYEEEPIWFKTKNKNVVIKYPQSLQSEDIDYISLYVRNAEDAIYSMDKSKYKQYVDLETWTSMYLLQEFFVQWDVEFASFYMYKHAEDPLLYAGPVWDFDLSCGELYPGYYPLLTRNTVWLKENRGGWLGHLGCSTEFEECFNEKFLSKFSGMIDSYMKNEFEELVEELSSSSYMNSKRWGKGDTKLREEAAELKAWIIDRRDFIEDYIVDKDQFVKIQFEFGWGIVSYYARKGEELGFLPTKEYGEIDYLENKDYGYGEITNWIDLNGEPITADIIVNEPARFKAVYN